MLSITSERIQQLKEIAICKPRFVDLLCCNEIPRPSLCLSVKQKVPDIN